MSPNPVANPLAQGSLKVVPKLSLPPVQALYQDLYQQAEAAKVAANPPPISAFPSGVAQSTPAVSNQPTYTPFSALEDFASVLDRASGLVISIPSGTPLDTNNPFTQNTGIPIPQKFSDIVSKSATDVLGPNVGPPVGIALGIIGDPLNLVGAEAKAPKSIAEIGKAIEEVTVQLGILKDVKSEHVGSNLIKFISRTTGELPEITGKPTMQSLTGSGKTVKTSNFGRKGDDILQNTYGLTHEEAVKAIDDYKSILQHEKDLLAARKELLAAQREEKILNNLAKSQPSKNIETEMLALETKTQAAMTRINTATRALQERRFITSVKEIAPEIESRVAGQYIPRSTDRLAIAAKNFIADNPLAAESLARTGTDEKAVAVASELLNKLLSEAKSATNETIKGALYDKAAIIANDSARNLTEAGRTVQAASILGRLTPEGMTRFAAREIQKYNEGKVAGRKIPELTPGQAKEIADRMNAIGTMPDGVEKAMEFNKLQDYVSSLVPTPLWKKLITVWKAGLLTGLKTSGLNTMSNLFHGISEIAKDVPAVGVDSVASLFTGKRTMGLTVKGTASGVVEGFKKGWRYLKTGFDERNIADKLDYQKVNFGKSMFGRAIQRYEETVFHILGAEDQPFYYGAKARSMASQAIAEGRNARMSGKTLTDFVQRRIENPTDEMLRNATVDAETAVFQNPTALASIAKKIQSIPGGEIVVPFGKTPAAVAMQLINYSPAGFVKTVGEQIVRGTFDQRTFSQGIGRAITGTGALWLGKTAWEHGMLALGRPSTEAEQKQWQNEGKTPNSIKIDGKWRSANVLGPIGNVLLTGGYFAQGFKETGSMFGGLVQASAGGLKSITDQTFLQGINQFTSAISDPNRSAGTFFSGLIGSIVPTIVGDVARATDSSERRVSTALTPETIADKLKSRIPGARQTLEPQVDTFGHNVPTPDFLTAMLDPTRPGIAKSTPVTDELKRLAEAGYQATPTQVGNKNGYKSLTPEQNTELWQKSGQILEAKLTNLFQTSQYKQLDDEGKKKVIDQFTQKAKDAARAAIVVEATRGMTGAALKKELSALKEDGVLTKAVFELYVDIR